VHEEKHKQYLSEKDVNACGKQLNIDSIFKKQSDTYGSRHPEQIKITDSLVENVITGCSLPLSLVENESFRKFMHDVNPKYNLPTRAYLTNKLIPDQLKIKSANVAKLIASVNNVAMTVDIWTDRRMHSYLACTGHTFVTGKSHSFLLSFQPIKGSHTGQSIAEELNNVIENNRIRTKLGCIITDNASNMKKAFQVLNELQTSAINTEDAEVEAGMDDEELWDDLPLEEQEHVNEAIDQHTTERLACYAHSLQLCVKDGLNQLKTATSLLSKCSKLANLVHQSATFRDAFENSFGNGRSVPKANATRWNSLYIQLSSIAKLNPTKLNDMLRGEHDNLIFTQRETGMLRELVDILQPFAEATDLLQGQDYPTIGCVVPSIVGLHKCLTTLATTVKYHGPLVNTLTTSLHERFGGLLQNIKILTTGVKIKHNFNFGSHLYLMASALDPNFSLLWLEEDHPGSEDVKRFVRESIMSKHIKYTFFKYKFFVTF
jgi:hypothetical protein